MQPKNSDNQTKKRPPMPSMLVERVPGICSRCDGFYHDLDCPIGALIWTWRLRRWWDMQQPVYMLMAGAIA